MQSTRETWPEMDQPTHRLITRLTRLNEIIWRDAQRHLDRADLTRLEYDILATLRKAEPPHAMRPSDLCQFALASSGGMSIALKKLRARGYVTLETAPRDARSKIVRLTDDGVDAIETVSDAMLTDQISMLARIVEESEVDNLAERLKLVLNGVD
ncbi:MAG: MarR family transcriptional regulator [Pseudomonadota bacterium]